MFTLQDCRTTWITVVFTLHNKGSCPLSLSCHSYADTQHNADELHKLQNIQLRGSPDHIVATLIDLELWFFPFISSALWLAVIALTLQYHVAIMSKRFENIVAFETARDSCGSDHIAYLLVLIELRRPHRTPIWLRSGGFVADLGNPSATAKSSQKICSVSLP